MKEAGGPVGYRKRRGNYTRNFRAGGHGGGGGPPNFDIRIHKYDPRFAPAQARDLRWLSVEVSVLGPLEEVSAPLEQLEIGVHGVVVKKGSRSGLLLPQVAPEWGWDVPTLLAQVCLKAGLPETAWREGSPPATVYRFSAEVFGESA